MEGIPISGVVDEGGGGIGITTGPPGVGTTHGLSPLGSMK